LIVRRINWWSVSDWGWRLAALFTLVGLGVSTYLSVVEAMGTGPSCGVGGGCQTVAASVYSRLMGIPVAYIGVAGYSAMLIGVLAAIGIQPAPVRLQIIVLAAAAAGFLFSVYLTAVQAFFIGAFCVYCITSALAMTGILLAVSSAIAADWAASREELPEEEYADV
jgi:uncharacterized membrane protein